MDEFGKLLRNLREQCRDPINPRRKLSQIRLGELMGIELGDHGFSGVMVSYWENGKSKINGNDRLVLISLLKILRKHGGLKTVAQADELLEAGNYRVLNSEERKSLFGYRASEISTPDSKEQISTSRFFLERIFFGSPQEFQDWWKAVEAGPAPAWPRIVTAFLRRISDRLSASNILWALLWVWLWMIGYLLISPSMSWPFLNREDALTAILLYVGSSFVLPLFIGALVNTDKNTFWQANTTVSRIMVRLYVYQGAFTGFHLGYFAVFAVNLFLFFLHVRSIIWMQFILMGIPLIIGYIAAQVVPYNLWLAYQRLHLADGAIFFVFLVLGPFWGWFFMEFYQTLLSSFGILIVLLALTLLTAMMAWQFHRKGTTIIPWYWWVIFYGIIFICQITALLLD